MYAELTNKAKKELEESFLLKDKAIELLDLIAFEFKSDPTSVACFDLETIVKPAIKVSKRLKELKALNPMI